ncbi:MAG TPA: vWA domain-containing protein [Acidimicrobiia bacterium]
MKPVHISIVLDRSGSMSRIADDVVGGFNQFLRKQRETEGEARVTLVQFDSDDPFELLIDGVPLREVIDLDRTGYQPRSTTPLYDAVGRMIVRIDGVIVSRNERALPEEDQVVLIVTDGLENASTDFDRSKVFEMVSDRRKQGWVFVFLGADQDVYAEGGKVGVATANRVAWEKSKAGSDKMWKDIAYSTTTYREKEEFLRRQDRDRFHEEDPDKE